MAVGASAFPTGRAVTAVTGRSVTALRTALRVRHVVDHLDDGGVTLAGLALATGFSDQAHLTRAFRAHTGTTPGRARRYLSAVTGPPDRPTDRAAAP